MLLKARPKKAETVNVAAEDTNMRTVQLPLPKKYTDAELDELMKDGKDPIAVCDVTGEAIYNQANVNEIKSDRPELNGLVISTAALKKILEGTVNAVTVAKIAKKPTVKK